MERERRSVKGSVESKVKNKVKNKKGKTSEFTWKKEDVFLLLQLYFFECISIDFLNKFSERDY